MTINKKRQRLESILERLESGEDVSLRDFKNAIPTDEYGSYEQAVEFRKMELSGTFGSCTAYDEWLKKGIFEYNRAEGFSGKNTKNSKKFHERAQNCFQRAIQALREEFEQNPNIALAYDRGVELDAGDGGAGGLDPHSMPRLKSSKSHMSFDRDGRKIDKRKLKIEAAKRAIEALIREEKSGQLESKKEVKRKEGAEGNEGIKREEGTEEGARKRAVSDAQGDRLRAMLKKLHESATESKK
jgi:hypothetical protein